MIEIDAIMQQMRMLKELVRMMTPEQKKIFEAFWLQMGKEMFGQ